MVSVIIEQRIVVKFHFNLGKTATETYNLLKEVYGSQCLSRARVFEWFKRFKDGRQDVEDDSQPGRPSTSKTDENVEQVASLIRSDRRFSIRAIAETVNIDKECVKSALKGTRFESVEAVKEKAARLLKELTKDDFQHCFQQWEIRMERCRDREGVYIEGDNK
ncbi:protein GVQW3 [Trichonephila clavipes]|nr:protein GVQW3 [Trichonephila clavipes]